jgi:hypothetical protein
MKRVPKPLLDLHRFVIRFSNYINSLCINTFLITSIICWMSVKMILLNPNQPLWIWLRILIFISLIYLNVKLMPYILCHSDYNVTFYYNLFLLLLYVYLFFPCYIYRVTRIKWNPCVSVYLNSRIIDIGHPINLTQFIKFLYMIQELVSGAQFQEGALLDQTF